MGYSFDPNKGFNSSASLPVGGYICQIKAAPKYQVWDGEKYTEATSFEAATRTAIPFDIVEGDFKNFFQKKFDEDESEGRKWKGMLYLRHPKDTDKFDTNERRYNSFGAALMESNSNFVFKIDNNKALNGKFIGIVFREKEFKKNDGEVGIYAEPYSTYPVDDIRAGKYKIPKKSTLKEDASSEPSAPAWSSTSDVMEELPFA